MDKEIETIIFDLGNYASNEKPQRNEHNTIIPYSLHYTDANLLFGYICELEEENKKLKENRHKAIEYINDNFNEEDAIGYLVTKDHIEELLNKIRGERK